ncbi:MULTISPECIES: glycerophosphodiester phosphodiesterase family protein [Actinomadura]|uniref:Glycerophosphodiester phosphodiesterase family protein n=1 Tax=Actinomadura yumaensis TaxID=111807 RepID=A0ABW2CSC9_9ACTN|nr:glycerophosphodiester phosphodiesterase family protein [Actinomadura sp. J1-007]MWK35056.1 glycerophosphodiester phosphodiesterase [Actinomadura sp. J1-007]
MDFNGGRAAGAGVEVHGHRGARGLRPENTLPGFAYALELGVDAVELDVGRTADGVPVLNHDQALSPLNVADTRPATPGDPAFPYVGTPIRDLTLAQIRTVDAGVRRPERPADDPFARTQARLPGTPLPTLDEACALIGTAPAVRLHVELKTDPSWPRAEVAAFTAAVADVLAAHGLTARGRLLAFDWRVLAEARRYDPRLGRVALVERKTLVPGAGWLAGLDPADPVGSALEIGATALSPEHLLTTPELVGEADRLALPVAVWTVNDPAEMARFAGYGVDAIVTDRPDRLRRVLAGLGLPLPVPEPAPVLS